MSEQPDSGYKVGDVIRLGVPSFASGYHKMFGKVGDVGKIIEVNGVGVYTIQFDDVTMAGVLESSIELIESAQD